MLQKWHSVSEFYRLLTKYLLGIHTHNDVRELDRTQFSLYKYLIIPITLYLKEKGIDFRFRAMVTNLQLQLNPRSSMSFVAMLCTLKGRADTSKKRWKCALVWRKDLDLPRASFISRLLYRPTSFIVNHNPLSHTTRYKFLFHRLFCRS